MSEPADVAKQRLADGRAWGCDNVDEGTLHNGSGDARVDGAGGDRAEAAAATAARLSALEAAARELRLSRKRRREEIGEEGGASSSTAGAEDETLPAGASLLCSFFGALDHFALRSAKEGGSELELYDAMRSPDRALLKSGFFVAEGSLVIEQLLALREGGGGPAFRLVSVLGTEAMLARLAPVFDKADEAMRSLPAGGEGHQPSVPCLVFGGSRSDLSSATNFKHTALSIMAIARRPSAGLVAAAPPLAQWAAALRPAAGMRRPTLLILDGVIKPDNVGSLFRSALAFGIYRDIYIYVSIYMCM